MKQTYHFFALFIILTIGCQTLSAQQKTTYLLKENIPYYSEEAQNQNDYIAERCKLDIYYPENLKDYVTVVWFHGGGITGGNKFIPEKLKEKGYCCSSCKLSFESRSTLPGIH